MATYYPPPCLDLSGVPPGAPPISVLRTGKDVMPFRQGVVVTTYMSDFIPPNLMPGYCGHLPKVSTAFGNTYGNETKKYFQNYRHEILSRCVRPKFTYGRLPCDFSPFPDVAIAQKVISQKKLGETPNIRPMNIDFCRSGELARFYQQCQDHRDYYTDKTDSIYPDDYFELGRPYPVRCPVDERLFKLPRFLDSCDVPEFLGAPLRCGAMPCIQHKGLLQSGIIAKPCFDPFQCVQLNPNYPKRPKVVDVRRCN